MAADKQNLKRFMLLSLHSAFTVLVIKKIKVGLHKSLKVLAQDYQLFYLYFLIVIKSILIAFNIFSYKRKVQYDKELVNILVSVRKIELQFYKIKTCLRKTTTCIGLQAGQIFSENMYIQFLNTIFGVAFAVPFLSYFQKLYLLVMTKI